MHKDRFDANAHSGREREKYCFLMLWFAGPRCGRQAQNVLL